MSDAINTLTALAQSVFQAEPDPAVDTRVEWFAPSTSDVVLAQSQRIGLLIMTQYPQVKSLALQIFAEPGLENLAPVPGELDPMILHPAGGSRNSPAGLITGLLTSAYLQMYYLRLVPSEETFVRIVLECFEQLRRAARGEQITAHLVLGFVGVTLDEGVQITTPWGIARPAPKPPTGHGYPDPLRPQTTCTLVRRLAIPVKIDRAATPDADFGNFDLGVPRAQLLFPLACALGSKESTNPAVPLNTWWTLLLPFQIGVNYSAFMVIPRPKPVANIGERAREVEKWAQTLDESHATTVDVAVRRIISASAQRLDRSDALIDAVIVWENLFGTRTEVTFRVTAAIAKVLESDPSKRRAMQKSLAKIYDMRSRVVHGDVTNPERVDAAATQAVDVGVRVLRFCYAKGKPWLTMTSTDRTDSLLLEEP